MPNLITLDALVLLVISYKIGILFSSLSVSTVRRQNMNISRQSTIRVTIIISQNK